MTTTGVEDLTAASGFLMGGKGVYANYSGTMANGVKVGGRIHATAIDGVLYCLQKSRLSISFNIRKTSFYVFL